MKMLSLLFSLLAIALAEASQTPLSVTTDPIDSVQLCCTALSEALPSLVHLPGSAEYEHQQHTYFILQHTEIQPSCRVSPATSSDVSLIMTTLTKNSCPFAITVEEEKGLVRLGPGNNWGSVYAAMEPYNLTTVGGRMPEVGVGGFFLGGGISLLSFQHGFGSDNIFNYELVLSNGTILNANASSHPDLFWALKLGSSNFGIVTRFDVRTYPLKPHVWGGIRAYPLTTSGTPTLISNWVTFARSEAAKREELQALILGREEIVTIWHASLSDVPGPPLSTSLPVVDRTRKTTLADLVDDLQSSDFADKRRNRWFTLTVKLDAPFIWDMFEHAKGMFDELELEFEEMRWNLLFQPVTQGFVSASEETGGNPFRSVLMDSEDGLAIALFLISWTDSTHDSAMNYASRTLCAWSESLARQRDVYGRSVSKGDLERLREVKGVYDKEGILGRLWRGGFKIPGDEGELDEGERKVHYESPARSEL
ncbi:hypothetical protein BDP27DRAFT_1369462 [Rhodocollybia butyracea]|uniref:FAD-binding PCMH-type domain-containing protein n=1 Tax=Rhodocollybia butyracea TaxID=206335 RepID=A0A9P5PB11_9AGAR|nr:hypothetical protein BDP27DRAFT_1369462 [Rhodocollybia butyracea]